MISYTILAKNRAKDFLEYQQYRVAKESILLANRFAFATDRVVRKATSDEIRSDSLWNKIELVETNLSVLQSQAKVVLQPDAQFYLNQAQNMLNLARENFKSANY